MMAMASERIQRIFDEIDEACEKSNDPFFTGTLQELKMHFKQREIEGSYCTDLDLIPWCSYFGQPIYLAYIDVRMGKDWVKANSHIIYLNHAGFATKHKRKVKENPDEPPTEAWILSTSDYESFRLCKHRGLVRTPVRNTSGHIQHYVWKIPDNVISISFSELELWFLQLHESGAKVPNGIFQLTLEEYEED